MSILAGHDLEMSLGGSTIFSGVSCRLEDGQCIGLVGPNGCGKTTLLRLLSNELTPDVGNVTLAKGRSLAYLPQQPTPPPGKTVRQWLLSAFEDVFALERQLSEVNERLGHCSAEDPDLASLLSQQVRLQDQFEAANGYEVEHRVERTLTSLGLPEDYWEEPAEHLSGGEKSRADLARTLVGDAQVILLDEPTNHLDLQAIEWIESFLQTSKRAVVVVSHDRYFLDRVADSIWEMRAGQLTAFGGNYSAYRRQRSEQDSRARKEVDAFQQDVRRQETFIRRNIASGGTASKQAQSRRKQLERRLTGPSPKAPPPERQTTRLHLGTPARSGEYLLELHDVAVGYPSDVDGAQPAQSDAVIRDLRLELRRGDKLGVVGPNGCGKTTLLKLIADELPPLRGQIRPGHNVELGWFRQEAEDLDPESPAVVVAQEAAPKDKLQRIRNVLGSLGLSGSKQETPVGKLSGGERARVSLARVILRQPNLLLLDEPTNHLDFAARHALEDALAAYEGSLVVVSHDRYFIDRVVTRTLLLEHAGGTARVLPGNYTDMKEKLETEAEEARVEAKQLEQERRARERKKAGGRKAKAARPQAAPRKKRRPLEELEATIIEQEGRRAELTSKLSKEEIWQDPQQARSLQEELASLEAELEGLNEEWELWAG